MRVQTDFTYPEEAGPAFLAEASTCTYRAVGRCSFAACATKIVSSTLHRLLERAANVGSKVCGYLITAVASEMVACVHAHGEGSQRQHSAVTARSEHQYRETASRAGMPETAVMSCHIQHAAKIRKDPEGEVKHSS